MHLVSSTPGPRLGPWITRLAVALTLLAGTGGATVLNGQIFNWDSSTSNTFTIGPWTPGAPTFLAGADETLNFGAFINAVAPGYTATNSVVGGAFVRSMNFNNTYGSPGIVIANTTPLIFNSAGGFDPSLNQNGFGVASIGAFQTLNAMSIGGSGAGNLNITGGVTNNTGGTGNVLTINQTGGGPANMGSTVLFGAAGTWGTTANTIINNGNVAVGNSTALGGAANTVTFNSGSFRFNGTALNVANNFTLNNTMTVLSSSGASASNTFSGILSGTGGLTVNPLVGLTLSLTGANTFSGNVVYNGGQNNATGFGITLSGANGRLTNANNITISGNSSLTLDNSTVPTAARLNSGAIVNLNSSRLTHQGNAGTATTTTFNTLNSMGQALITVNPGAASPTGAGSTLTIGTWNRNQNGTALITARDLGLTPGANVGTIVITNDPGTLAGGFMPFAVANITSSTTSPVNTFVRRDAGTGRLVGLSHATDYQGGLPATQVMEMFRNTDTTANYRATSIQGGLANTTVNSLILDTTTPTPFVGTSIAGSGTLNVTSGAILSSTFGTTTQSGPFRNTVATNELAFGGNTGYVHTIADLNITSQISGSAGLVKSGLGTLVLTRNNTFTGDVYVNSGLLSISADNNLGNAANSIRLNSGNFNGLVFNPSVQFGSGSTTSLTTARNINIGESGGSIFVQNANNHMTASGTISGSGFLWKGGTGTLSLTGTNTYTGPTVLFDGVLKVQSDAALGAASGNIVFSQGGTAAAVLQANSSFTTIRNVIVQSANGAQIFTNGNNLTMGGVIGTQNLVAAGLVKLGTGDLTLTNTNTYTGATTIGGTGGVIRSEPAFAQTGGRMVLSGANGSIALSNGIFINPGSTLRLDNSTAVNDFRVGRVGVTMNKGVLEVVGSSVSDTNTAIGALATIGFGNTITLDQTTGTNRVNSLTITSLTNPTNNSLTFIRGTNLGGASGNRTSVVFNTAPTQFAGIIPTFVGSNSATGVPTDFLTLGAALPNGQTPVQLFTGYVANSLNAGAGAVTSISANQVFTTNSTVGAARLTAGNLNFGNFDTEVGYTWNIQSGMLLTTGVHSFTNSAGSANPGFIVFGGYTTGTGGGATPGFGRIINNNTLTIGGTGLLGKVILDGTNLTKSGAGTLVMNSTSTATVWNIDQGIFQYGVGQNGAMLGTATVNVAPGATVNLNNNTGVSLGTIGGFGTFNIGTGGLTLTGQTGTFAGSLVGSGAMTFNGTGQLTVSGNNATYAGGWKVESGVLSPWSNNALGTGQITMGDSAGALGTTFFMQSSGVNLVTNNFVINNGSTGVHALQQSTANSNGGTFSGTFAINNTAAVGLRLNGGFSTTATPNAAWTLSNTVSGVGNINWFGGNWNLHGNNTFAGGVTFDAGQALVFGVGHNNALGTGALSVSGAFGGMLRADNGARTLANSVIVNAGTNNFGVTGVNDLTLSGGLLLNTAGGNHTFFSTNAGTTTLSGIISGADGLSSMTQNGFGTVVLSGANTLGGGYTLNSGVLGLGNNSAVGSGTLTVNNGGVLRASGGARNIANAVTVGGNFGVDGSNALTLSGPMDLGASPRTVVVSNSANTEFSGPISGVGGLVKDGSGVLFLTGTNAYTGTTTVSNGTLRLANGNAILDAGAVNLAGAGSILDVLNNETIGSLAGVTSTTTALGSNTLTTGGNNSSTVYNGSVTQIGGGLTKVGTGTMTLGGSVTGPGQTLIQGGTLALGASNVFNGNSNVAVNGGSFTLAGFSDSVNGLLVDIGSVTGTGTLTSLTTIDGRQGSVSAVLGGSVGLTKTTPGTLTLSGANTYSGDTNIDDGTLALGAGGSIFGSPNINVDFGAFFDVTGTGGYSLASGQSLNGTGTVFGDLTVGANSTLAPGNSPGTMTFIGDLEFAADGNFLWEINDAFGTPGLDPGWDMASIFGQLSITSTVLNPFAIDVNSLDLFNTPQPLGGIMAGNTYTWTIASATGGITGFSQNVFSLNTGGFGSPVAGTFAILTSGNNLNLQFTAVPEPSGAILFGLVAGTMFFGSRRRRNAKVC